MRIVYECEFLHNMICCPERLDICIQAMRSSWCTGLKTTVHKFCLVYLKNHK
jgi:hypothetical protein